MTDYARAKYKRTARLVRRKGKKSKRIPKIKVIPYKTLFNKAVNLFQTYIRNRDKWCVIGHDVFEERKRCGGYLTCGHLISRGKRVVIFDEKNSNGQCQNHNGLHRNYPEIYTNWWINHYGIEAHNELVEKSKVNFYKHTREQLENIVKKYGSPDQ